MKLIISVLILMIGWSGYVQAQYTYFNNAFGIPNDQGSNTTTNVEIIDSSYYLFSFGVNSGIDSYEFQKVNSEGDLVGQSSITFPGEFIYLGVNNSFVKVPQEDNFLFSQGKLDSSGLSGYLLKVSSDLDTLWSHEYDLFPESTYFYTHVAVSDGFIIAGENSVFQSGRGTFLLKVDGEGNELWTSILRTPNEGIYRNFYILAVDDGYLLGGAQALPDGTAKGLITKVDLDGNVEWEIDGENTEIFGGGFLLHENDIGEIITVQGIAYQTNPPTPDLYWVETRISKLDLETQEFSKFSRIISEYGALAIQPF